MSLQVFGLNYVSTLSERVTVEVQPPIGTFKVTIPASLVVNRRGVFVVRMDANSELTGARIFRGGWVVASFLPDTDVIHHSFKLSHVFLE